MVTGKLDEGNVRETPERIRNFTGELIVSETKTSESPATAETFRQAPIQ